MANFTGFRLYGWFLTLRMVFGIYVWFWNLRMVLDMNTWIPCGKRQFTYGFEFTYGFGIYVWFWI